MEDLIKEESNLPTKTLAELKVEIKFHLGQMAGHAVEIGKLLIQAKEQVGHGEFGKWVEENFHLNYRMAANFMAVAKRFSNVQLTADLNQTQMMEMLALPAEETEKFISEKATEGNPVEDMTAKNLREEIKEYKERLSKLEQERDGYKVSLDNADAQLENLGAENEKLRNTQIEEAQKLGKLADENLELKENLNDMKDQLESLSQTTVEVAPEDYEPTKKELAEAKIANAQLQEELKKLQEKPVEVAVEYPADYETNKKELADIKAENVQLQEKIKNQQEEAEKFYYIKRNIEQIFTSAQVLLNEVELFQVVSKLADTDANLSFKINQSEHLIGEISRYFNTWREKNAD